MLRQLSLPHLKEFLLDLGHGLENKGPNDDAYVPPSALPIGSTKDQLSLAIHSTSQNLSKLKITGPGVISSDLFWPENGRPHWPSLRQIRVDFSAVAPEGEWRYELPEVSTAPSPNMWSSDESQSDESDYSSYDPDDEFDGTLEDQPRSRDILAWKSIVRIAALSGPWPTFKYRKAAIPDMMTPMFVAAVRATTQMPKMKVMDVRSYGGRQKASNRMVFLERGANCNDLEFEPGEYESYYTCDPEDGIKPNVYWITRQYDPSPVNELWLKSEAKMRLRSIDRTFDLELLSVFGLI